MKDSVPVVLCIAGSDSGGGAGIQADIKTLNTMKVFATSAITCVTAQNTKEVLAINNLLPDIIRQQISAIKNDFNVSAIKVGMLFNKQIIKIVAKSLSEFKGVPIIVDPVMISKSGDFLLKKNSIDYFKEEIIPKSFLITPNIHEAKIISNMDTIETLSDIKICCDKFRKMGAKNVLIKGGHLNDDIYAIDYLSINNKLTKLSSKRHNTKNTHGTGCTLSASISGNIAKGMDTLKAVRLAKNFTNRAIKNALNLGMGHGPLNHFP